MLSVLSWNVLNENADAGRIHACLDRHPADVVLAQEATPDHLEALRRRYAYVATARDYVLKGVPCHLAIAASEPLHDVRVIEHFPADKRPPTWLGRFMGWAEFIDTLSAEVEFGGGRRLRLVVAHTSAAVGPSVRRGEVEAAAAHVPADGPCIFAADFNSFAAPWNAPLLALPLGYGRRDLCVRERRALDAWFAARGFAGAVEGVTFPRFFMQFDQIYGRQVRFHTGKIVPGTFGSDHRPIRVTIGP